MSRRKGWRVIIDKFHNRLSKWKTRLLSSGGRLTLIKSVLGSLGIYFMSFFRVPVGVVKTLESIRARFFWGSTEGERKISWVIWDIILNSLEQSGLGVGSLQALNTALLYKWK